MWLAGAGCIILGAAAGAGYGLVQHVSVARSGGLGLGGGVVACLGLVGYRAYRDAIELRYRDDWTHQQIADRLKRSEGAVKLLLHRARLALKSCLLAKLGTAP